ncbi:MAG TPA: pitrilysin family protein [Anaerolineaceae bacterium]|jgi:zinc protease
MKNKKRIIHFSSSANTTLPGPDDITRVEFPNGLVLLTRPNFSSPSVVISGYLPAGSIYEPDDKLGLAHFTASASMRGTHQRPFQHIYDALESVGANLGLGAGAHTTGFNGRALVEDLHLLLGLLVEVLQQPAFPDDQVERLRAQILTGLSMRAQDTGEMASLTFDEIIFAGHPYRRPEDGYTETIQAITQDDLLGFHHQYYGPQRMVLAIVGAISPAQAIDEVTQVLGSWENPRQPGPAELPSLAPMTRSIRKHIPIAGKTQTDLVIGAVGPTRKSRGYVSASLGNNILGQFGMYGRIGDVVREQSGLAYYAFTSLNAGIGPGSWEVSAGVNPNNLEKTIDLIKSEISRFTREPVTPGELADSQANYIGRLPLSLESNGGMASALLNLERFDLGLDYYRRYAQMVNQVTPEAILETVRLYLNPEILAIVSAGPGE